MGRRIATSTARKASVGQETVIENWQPFQIKGRRVTPCRVYLPYTFPNPGLFYMPLINGIPMDDPRASLTGTGDVFLNVKFEFIQEPDEFTVHNYRLALSESNPPNISTVSAGRDFKYSSSIYSLKPVVMTGSGWYSWKIGSIGFVRQNNMRYFSGVGFPPGVNTRPEYLEDIDFSTPIYKKKTYAFDGSNESGDKQWGAVEISTNGYSNAVSTADLPFEESWSTDLTGVKRFNEFGDNQLPFTFQDQAATRRLFRALAVRTPYGESL